MFAVTSTESPSRGVTRNWISPVESALPLSSMRHLLEEDGASAKEIAARVSDAATAVNMAAILCMVAPASLVRWSECASTWRAAEPATLPITRQTVERRGVTGNDVRLRLATIVEPDGSASPEINCGTRNYRVSRGNSQKQGSHPAALRKRAPRVPPGAPGGEPGKLARRR